MKKTSASSVFAKFKPNHTIYITIRKGKMQLFRVWNAPSNQQKNKTPQMLDRIRQR
ncbi:hypothetical protein HMPREF1141_0680 [Clostridium sp. MSTE9]|nr:hypothetical protein HMPREF1141_0680 [Clostridium sp. MSTE9]